MIEKENHSDDRLGKEPIGKLILKLAIPAVAAQIVNVLYNIVDRMYIGHIPGAGAAALTGLGVCFPIIMLISAFSAFIGAGGAPLATIRLGSRDRNGAEKILGNSITALLILSVVLTLFFLIFKEPILYAFGASDTTIYYSIQYLDIYLLGTIFVQISIGLNSFISCQGHAKTAMISVLIGAVTNIVLDPIFIFTLGMGIKGAALATIISQALSAFWIVSFLSSKKSSIRIRRKNMSIEWKILASITALGISPFIMQSTESLIAITFNSGLQKYGGDLYVGAMTIMNSVMQLLSIPVMGFAYGTQPIISYNYGAGNFDKVKKTWKIIFTITMIITVIPTTAVMVFPEIFAMIFTGDEKLIALTAKTMPIFFAGMLVFGIQMACQSSFVGMGQAKVSLFLALWRKVILLIPMAIILPRFFGVNSIFFAEPIADTVSAFTAGFLFYRFYKKLK